MKSKTTPTSKSISEQALDRVKQDVLALVSHELRTPLTSVINALRILREEGLGSTDRETFLEMAERNADTLNAKLTQLLDLSHLLTGRLVCRFHELSLKNLVMSLIERLVARAEVQGYEIVIDSSSQNARGGVVSHLTELPTILGDRLRLEQAIGATFENAIKFSPAGSRVTVRVRGALGLSDLPAGLASGVRAASFPGWAERSEYTVLEVINPVLPGDRNVERVFGVLSHHEDVLHRERDGVGGSLAIAAEVLRQHAGAIEASNHSDPSQFVVSMAIPMLQDDSALLKVLEGRLHAFQTELGSMVLIVLALRNPGSITVARDALKAAVFRASDSVYALPEAGQVAIVMDDCKRDDAPRIVQRLLRQAQLSDAGVFEQVQAGMAAFPDDATDPLELLSKARASLAPRR